MKNLSNILSSGPPKVVSISVTGSVFNIIRLVYNSDKAWIKMGESHSDFFNLGIRVRQGCILSPLLFYSFISDLVNTMEDKLVYP